VVSERSERPLGSGETGALDGLILDIGGEVGALVLLTDAGLAGSEIEVSPVTSAEVRTHAEVHPRRGRSATVHGAVFVELAAGRYTVWGPDGSPLTLTNVEGGRVTELDLRRGDPRSGTSEDHAESCQEDGDDLAT
jgi:hypothetical protein